MPRPLRWRDLVPGAVVLGVLLATTAATLKYARIGRLGGDTVRFYTALPGARNVMGGTEVWVNGRKVGRVKAVRFAPPATDTARRVVIELEVLARYRAQIRRNSVVRLSTGSRLLGPTIIYVTAGTSAAPAIPAGDTIPGSSAGNLTAVTESFGEVAREFPKVMANVKVLSASLASTRGTVGALTSLDAPKRFEALLENASRLGSRAGSDSGTLGLVAGRGAALARAKAAMAQADTLRLLVAGHRSSLGRFRRDSTLARSVADVRNEISIARAILATRSGSTLSRFGQDSIIAVQMAEMEKQMGALFADIKRRPFRYLGF